MRSILQWSFTSSNSTTMSTHSITPNCCLVYRGDYVPYRGDQVLQGHRTGKTIPYLAPTSSSLFEQFSLVLAEADKAPLSDPPGFALFTLAAPPEQTSSPCGGSESIDGQFITIAPNMLITYYHQHGRTTSTRRTYYIPLFVTTHLPPNLQENPATLDPFVSYLLMALSI